MKIKKRWTYELCHNEALKYPTKSDFQKGSSCAYKYSRIHGFLNDICSHMKIIRNRWTYESCKQEALKYSTRGEFRKENQGAYLFAINHDFLEEVCKHMKKVIRWNFSSCQKEALKYKARSDFEKGSRGAYKYAKKHDFFDKICSHMLTTAEFRNNWTYESCKKEASLYPTRNKFRLGSSGAYKFAIQHNFLDDCCVHMESDVYVWTYELCKQEALKYQVRQHFQLGSGGAYNFARKNGILKNICKHMRDVIFWDYESCKKEALKYTTKSGFNTWGHGASNFAKKYGFYDEICSHMPNFANQNRREQKLQTKIHFALIKQYPDLQISTEYFMPTQSKEKGKVDFYIQNPNNKNFIIIELKHSYARWSTKKIQQQMNKYKKSFKEKEGFKGVFLFSNNGKYGQPISQIPDLISKELY